MTAEIYGTTTCPYCDKAKALLTERGVSFTFKNIDEDDGAFDELIARMGTWSTVPQIFIDGEHVGGFAQLTIALAEEPL